MRPALTCLAPFAEFSFPFEGLPYSQRLETWERKPDQADNTRGVSAQHPLEWRDTWRKQSFLLCVGHFLVATQLFKQGNAQVGPFMTQLRSSPVASACSLAHDLRNDSTQSKLACSVRLLAPLPELVRCTRTSAYMQS